MSRTYSVRQQILLPAFVQPVAGTNIDLSILSAVPRPTWTSSVETPTAEFISGNYVRTAGGLYLVVSVNFDIFTHEITITLQNVSTPWNVADGNQVQIGPVWDTPSAPTCGFLVIHSDPYVISWSGPDFDLVGAVGENPDLALL